MQNHTVALILKNNKKNSAGHIAIYLRITIGRVPSYKSTGYYIPRSQWDDRNESVKSSYPLADEINKDISQKKKEALNKIIEAAHKHEILTAQQVKERLGVKLNNVFDFLEAYLKELRGKRGSETFRNYEYVDLLKDYHGSRNLAFEQITPHFLSGFENWLRSGGIKSDNPSNTIVLIWAVMRSLFNAAITKGITTVYPFKQYVNPKPVKKSKEYLSLDELDKWQQYALTAPRKTQAAAWYFLFGCYTGLRISDWRKFNYKKMVHEKDLVLRATKNKGLATIPVHSRLQIVLDHIKHIPFTVTNDNLTRGIRRVAKGLEIEKHLTSHCARKTFAITMCLNRGISSETAAKLMAITLKTFVENYSEVTPEKIRIETSMGWDGL